MRRFIFLLISTILVSYSAQAELSTGMNADVVLGQPDFFASGNNNGGISARSLSNPRGSRTDGKRLFTGEFSNHRILIWNEIPNRNHTPADVVLGQPDFESSAANNGGLSARSLSAPREPYSDGVRLFVNDRGNNRVLIWNQIPTNNFTPADVVVGQPDFVSNVGGLSASRVNGLNSIYSDGTRLYASSSTNHRVLIWHRIPTENGAPADVVVGQPNFTSNTARTTQDGLNFPIGIVIINGRMVITESVNDRFMIWNQIPTTNGTPADLVVGQENFTSSDPGLSRTKFSGPSNVATDGTMLFMDDQGGDRILVWKKLPAKGGLVPADFVIGQDNFTTNDTNTLGPARFNNPIGVSVDAKHLVVTDAINDRILIFNLTKPKVDNLGPQFSQGKAVVGKVFFDWNGNGKQDYFGPPSLELRRGSSRVAREDFDGDGRQDAGGIS